MSGTLIPMTPLGINPWEGIRDYNEAQGSWYRPALIQAEAAERAAHAGLLGEQTQAAHYGNLLTGVRLPVRMGLWQQTLPTSNPGGSASLRQAEGANPGGGQTAYPGESGASHVAGQPTPQQPPAQQPPAQQPPPPARTGAIGGGPPLPNLDLAQPEPPIPPRMMGGGGPAEGTEAHAALQMPPVSLASAALRPQDVALGSSGTAAAPGPVQQQPLPPPAIGGGAPVQQASAIAPTSAPQAPAPQAPAVGGGGNYQVAQAGTPGGQIGGLPQIHTGPGGAIYGGMSVPLPWMALQGIDQADNKPEAIKQALEARKMMLGQMITGTFNQQGIPASGAVWDQTVDQAYDGGLITNVQWARFHGHPERAMEALQGVMSPTEIPMMQGAQEAARATATIGPEAAKEANRRAIGSKYDTVKIPFTSPDGQTSVEREVRKSVAIANGWLDGQGNAIPQTSPAPLNPNGYMSGGAYSSKVKGVENTTGNPNARNPLSSATGDGQFIDDTWVDVLSRNRPDLVAGKTRAQVLAMRGDTDLSDQMIQAYGRENAQYLGQHNEPVNATTIALAHRLGPEGAVRVLNASVGTPISALVKQDVMDANPDLRGRTVGQLLDTYLNKFGRSEVEFQPAGTRFAGPGAPNQQQQKVQGGGGTGGWVPGQTTATPSAGNKARMEGDQKQLEADSGELTHIQGAGQQAASGKPVLWDMKRLAPESITGSLAEPRLAIARFFGSFAPDQVQQWLKDSAGLEKAQATVSNTDQMIKLMQRNVTNAETALGQATGSSVRIGAMLTQFMARANPNPNMPVQAIQAMASWSLAMSQMIEDYAREAKRVQGERQGYFNADRTKHEYGKPLADFQDEWLNDRQPNSPIAYNAAAMAMAGLDYKEWSRGLTDPQKRAVYSIIKRADPSMGTAKDSLGQVRTASEFPD